MGQDVNRKLCSVREAAQRLGCSATNIYALIDSGELPFVRIGKAKGYRIDTNDLDAFIEARKQTKQGTRRNRVPRLPRLKHIKL